MHHDLTPLPSTWLIQAQEDGGNSLKLQHDRRAAAFDEDVVLPAVRNGPECIFSEFSRPCDLLVLLPCAPITFCFCFLSNSCHLKTENLLVFVWLRYDVMLCCLAMGDSPARLRSIFAAASLQLDVIAPQYGGLSHKSRHASLYGGGILKHERLGVRNTPYSLVVCLAKPGLLEALAKRVCRIGKVVQRQIQQNGSTAEEPYLRVRATSTIFRSCPDSCIEARQKLNVTICPAHNRIVEFM
jgi:hypothetical protein